MELAEAVLETAWREGPRRAGAEAIGEVFEGQAPSIPEAQRSLDEARSGHRHLTEVAGLLEKELGAQRDRVVDLLIQRDRAVAAVLDTDGGVDRLLHEYDASRAWTECIAEAIRVIGPQRLPERYRFWDATNRPVPTTEPIAAQWKVALTALESGAADTALPLIG